MTTRPTGTQLLFQSANSGTHVLDTYLENCEIGGRSLYDLLSDIFDNNGDVDSTIFAFRMNGDQMQSRSGVYVDPEAGWVNIPDGYIFRARGTWATATAYKRLDLVNESGVTYLAVMDHTSGGSFAGDAANWQELAPTPAPGAANVITYSNATSGLTATDVQAAIDEVEGRLDTAETNLTNKLDKSGGTMTGAIAMGTNKITGLGAPTVNGDAARYDELSAKANKAGDTFTGPMVFQDEIKVTPQVITWGAAFNIDMSANANKETTSSATAATATLTNIAANQMVEVRVICNSASASLAWSGVDVWVGGAAPVLSTTVGRIDLIVLAVMSDGTTVIGHHLGPAY